MSESLKGLMAWIHAPKSSCTCRGTISGDKWKVVITDLPSMRGGGFAVSDEMPGVVIKEREDGAVYAEPIVPPPEGKSWNFGGCFVKASDSRFRKDVSKYPVPLHDALEPPPTKARGLLADIYADKKGLRGSCECSSYFDEVSSRSNQVVVLCDEPECLVEPTPRRPAVVVDHKEGVDSIRAIPAEEPKPPNTHTHRMFGGCYVFADNEAFKRIISTQPVPLHDRQDTWEAYEELSR